jgi:hypothetical protein
VPAGNLLPALFDAAWRQGSVPAHRSDGTVAVQRGLLAVQSQDVGGLLEQALDVTDSAFAADLETESHAGRNCPTANGLIHFSIATRFDGVQTA